MWVLPFIIQDEKSYFSISPWLSTPIWESMKNLMYLVHEINYYESVSKLVGIMKVSAVREMTENADYVLLFTWEAGVDNCLSARNGWGYLVYWRQRWEL